MSLKDKLKNLEVRLQLLVETNLARLLASPDLTELLTKNLVEAMTANLKQEEDRILAPNHFTIHFAPSLAADLRSSPSLLHALAQAIEKAGGEAGLTFPSPPHVSVLEDPDLSSGEFKTAARTILGIPGSTRALTQSADADVPDVPANAFLIINGNQVFPLTQPVVNVGRRVDNNLVIDNPSVSRIHAQLRAIDYHYVLFDLGSTGGTYVNSERIKRCVLYPGDVISLASVQMVYGQDAPRPLDEVQGYTQPFPVDQKKTITRRRSDNPATGS